MRTDDLGAIPLNALMQRNPGVDWAAVVNILFGCGNQAGEDNRNVARMAGLPPDGGVARSRAFISKEFRDAYELSEQVTVLLELEDELGLHDEHSFMEPLCESWTQPGKLVGEVANEFVQLIRDKATTREFRRRLTLRSFGSEQNHRRGKALIEALFARYARLNVVRIDFGYLREHRPTLERAKADLTRFLNNHRRNEFFHSVVGHIWHLEWAFESGYHWHVMFFLDGSKTMRDTYIAHQFGDYWNRVITVGRGRFHNCNADKNSYRFLGIGMITHDDEAKRIVLLDKVLPYLTRVDELARPRLPTGTRTFGTSNMPEPHPGTCRKRRRSPTVVKFDSRACPAAIE